jgi:BirA family biotin operon repressor/biotin-[acetyl-CoA-carboxylase] ligase
MMDPFSISDSKIQFLAHELDTAVVGKKLLYYPVVSSTMDIARSIALEAREEGVVIVAGRQTTGRGRLGRSWISPAGALAVSIILYPDIDIINQMIMLAALSVLTAVEQCQAVGVSLKWPNDVLIDGKKVAGILIESQLGMTSKPFCILGIGLNINNPPIAFADMGINATSIAAQLGKRIEVGTVLKRLLVDCDILYTRIKGGESLYSQWKTRLATLGQKVTITTSNGKYEGLAEDVNADGSLVLRQQDGRKQIFPAGDVSLR